MAQVFTITIIILSIALCVPYIILIINYYKWFIRLRQFNPSAEIQAVTTFSIIIPARNEENNIEACIVSIMQNHYPKNLFEIIIVDDFSTDTTVERVKKLQTKYSNLKLITLADLVESKLNSYKKKAIEIAVGQSTHDWIITTDADCSVTVEWLQLYNAYIQQNNTVFVAAPVMFINNDSLLSIFQCLDFISLQGITAASVSANIHSMCNGANLAYKKEAFYAVNGFAGVDNIASGDDMFLMHKIKNKYPEKIGYLFSSQVVVQTLPMPDLKSFINQRIRWASKATSYSDKGIFWVLLLVYLFNLYLLILPVACIFFPVNFIYWFLLIALKIIAELCFMISVAKFFKLKKLMWWFPLMQPFHIIYTVVSGWLGKFGKYEWKGRNVK